MSGVHKIPNAAGMNMTATLRVMVGNCNINLKEMSCNFVGK